MPVLSFFKTQAMPFRIKQLVIYVVSMAVGFAPTVTLAAQQKKASDDQTSLIKEFYRDSGYKGGGSVSDWIAKNPAGMHYKMRMLLQRLQYDHPEQKLPLLDFSEFQKDGKTYTRLIFKDGQEQQIIDIYKNKDKYIFKKDGVAFSYDDIYYADPLEFEGVSPALTLDQLQRASEVDQSAAADYQAKFRDFMNAMTVLTNLAAGEKPQFSYVNFILQVAYAGEKDGRCVTGGFFSKLATTKSPGYCGADDPNKKSLYCSGEKKSQFRCNPLVYGFAADGGDLCVPTVKGKKPSVYVSEGCNSAYDLNDPAAKGRLLSSILGNRAKLADDPADFYKKLRDYIKSASQYCGLPENEIEDRIRDGKINSFVPQDFVTAFPVKSARSGGKAFDYNEGHRTACSYLMNRLILTQQAASCSQNQVLASESSSPEERKNARKFCYGGAIVPAVKVEPPANRCEDLQARSADIKAEYEGRRLTLVEAKTKVAELESEKNTLTDCTLVSWLPTNTVTNSGVPVVEPATVTVRDGVGKTTTKKGPFDICTATTGRKIACIAAALVAACGLKLFGLCSKKSKPAPMAVGKPGEAQGTGSSTNRPARAGPTFVPGAR